MKRTALWKSLLLTGLFFCVAISVHFILNLIASVLPVEPIWGEEVKFLLSLLIALAVVLTLSRLSRYVYTYSKQLILKISLSDFIISLVGAVVGLTVSALASVPLSGLPEPWSWITSLLTAIAVIYASIWSFYLKREKILDWFTSIKLLHQVPLVADKLVNDEIKKDEPQVNPMIIDTSAIIDGRIGEIIKSGFLFGTLIIPNFILNELQQVADSSNADKRQRGRNGLKLLQALKRNRKVNIVTTDVDFFEIEDVDHKLIKLAKDMKAKIITCDYNLNAIAKMQGLSILNVNELAVLLKQQFLPGEVISVKVAQVGKANGQGIGYLPDGTMVVISDAANLIGQQVQAEVERVLQTAAGRMVFVRYSPVVNITK